MKNNRLKKVIIIIGVSVGIFILFKYILPIGAPFVLAFLLAAALSGQVSFLNKRIKIKRTIATVIIIGLYSALLGVVIWLFGGMLINQIRNIIDNLGTYYIELNSRLCNACRHVDRDFGLRRGTTLDFVDGCIDSMFSAAREKMFNGMLFTCIDSFKKVFVAFGFVVVFYLSLFFLTRDYEKINKRVRKSSFAREYSFLYDRVGRILLAFIKTQGIILLIVTVICCAGLFFLGNEYWLIIGIIIGIVDLLPFLASGTILLPWSVVLFINGSYRYGAVLLSLNLICYLVREFLSPKLMGKELGINPVFMLLAVYAGIMLFGLIGVITGPIAMLIGVEVIAYIDKNFLVS